MCITTVDQKLKRTEFCLHTSSSFNEDKGGSFICVSEEAPRLAEALADQEPARRASKFLDEQAQGPENDEFPYEIKELPGRGKGVIARRKIKQTEIVMVGFPAVVADDEFLGLRMGEEDVGRTMYRQAFRQLTDLDRVMRLAKSAGGDIFEDVMKTNSFGFYIGERNYQGLFPEISVSLRRPAAG
jgi:hypothetical protein